MREADKRRSLTPGKENDELVMLTLENQRLVEEIKRLAKENQDLKTRSKSIYDPNSSRHLSVSPGRSPGRPSMGESEAKELMKKLASERVQIENEANLLRDQNSSLSNEIEILRSKLNSVSEDIDSKNHYLENQLNEYKLLSEEQQADLSRFAILLKEREDHIELLERELAGLPKGKVDAELLEWNKRYANVRKSNLEGLNQLSTERDQMAEELARQNQRNFDLQNQINDLRRNADPKTEEELRVAQASIEEIEREWNKRYALLEQENRRLRSQAPSRRESFSPQRASRAYTGDHERVIILENENAALRDQLMRPRTEESEASERIRTEVERMNNELIYYREKVQELELNLIERDKELQRSREFVSPSRRSMSPFDKQITVLEREKEELQGLLDIERQNNSRITSSYAALEDRNKQMRQSLRPDGRKLLEQLMEKESQLKTERDRNEKLVQDLSFVEKENANLRQGTQFGQPSQTLGVTDRSEDIAILEGEINRLSEQVEYEKNKSLILEDRLQDLESENFRLNLTLRAKEDFEAENMELKKMIESMKYGDNRRLAEQTQVIQDELSLEKEKNRQLQHELSEREQETRNLNSKLASMAHELPTPQERASCIRASISGTGVRSSLRPSMRPSAVSGKSSFYGRMSSRYSNVRGSHLPKLSPVGKSTIRPSAPDIQITAAEPLESQGITYQEELEVAELKAISDHYKERSDMFEAQTNELSDEISRLRTKVSSIEDIRQENNSLREALDSLRIRSPEEFQRLTDELEKLNLILRNERDKVHRLESELIEKDNESIQMQNTLENALKKPRMSTTSMVRKSEMVRVASDIDQLALNLKIESEQKSALESRTEDLEFELNRLATRTRDLEEQNEMLNSLNASLKSGIDWQVREQINKLNSQLEESRAKNFELEERMRDQDRMVRKSRMSTPTRKSRVSMLDNFDRSQRLEDDLEELRGQLDAERRAKQEAFAHASELEQRVAALSIVEQETLSVKEESSRFRNRYESVRQNTPQSVFALTQDIEALERALKDEKDARIVCETNLFSRENEVARLNAQLVEHKNMEKEHRLLNNQIDDYKYEVNELRDSLLEAEDRIAYLEKCQPTSAVRVSRQPSPSGNRLGQEDAFIEQEEFRAQMEILEREWSQRYEELEGEYNRLRFLEDENKAITQENNGFRDRLSTVAGLKEFNLIQENVSLQNEIENMRKKIADNEVDMRGLTIEHSSFNSVKRECESLRQDKKILEEKCDSLTRALSDRDGRVGDLKRLSLADGRRETEYYKAKVRELESALEEQSQIIGSIERLAAIEEENTILKKQVIELTEKNDTFNKNNSILLTQNVLLALALDCQTDQHHKLDSSYSSRMREYESQVKKRSSVTNDQLDSVITLKKALEAESRDLRDRLNSLKLENQELRNASTIVQEEKTRIETEITILRDDSRRQISDWETKFRLLEERHIREIEELQANLETFRASMLVGPQDVSNERTAYELLIEELRDRLKVVEEELTHKDRELSSVRDYLSKAEGDYTKGSYFGMESNTIYTELQETKSSLDRMKVLRDQHENENLHLKERLNNLERSNSNLVNELEDLRTEKREISTLVLFKI